MMFASIESEINQLFVGLVIFLGIGFGLVALVISILAAVARAVCRQVKKGYVEEGGAKGMATKVAAKGGGKLLKKVITGKW